ncbi:hypothetical protein L798_03239 [Zootermopsis nevadensis]|uniref:Uncharacterized protein n=1 Tax=Zootermopsis nevadensis TaxID=136037 RepID=A0A067QIU8_ZOONE|nr:hypothetical protein L798_03239 [Zootermopsis nevadensis]
MWQGSVLDSLLAAGLCLVKQLRFSGWESAMAMFKVKCNGDNDTSLPSAEMYFCKHRQADDLNAGQ